MSYYHYTTGSHLAKIVKDGIIHTHRTLSYIFKKPVVWLTKSPQWDIARNVVISIENDDFGLGNTDSSTGLDYYIVSNDYMRKECGMCRIVVNENLPTTIWANYRHACQISDLHYNNIDKVSRELGSLTDLWLCSFIPITRYYWEGIEIFVGNEWIKWDEKISIERFLDLCMSCNGNNEFKSIAIEDDISEAEYKQLEFFISYEKEIIAFWEAHKHKTGYVQILINPEYELIDDSFLFVEKQFDKSKFLNNYESESNNYAYVQFLWQSDYTKYKAALAYEPESGFVMLPWHLPY